MNVDDLLNPVRYRHADGHPWNVQRSELRAVIQRNGVRAARRYCLDCGDPCSEFISHRALRAEQVDIGALPVHADYRHQSARCEACGASDGAELHHLAPYEIFGEQADMWPRTLLCRPCHRTWHDQMNQKGPADT